MRYLMMMLVLMLPSAIYAETYEEEDEPSYKEEYGLGDEWDVSLGFITGAFPDYEGSNDYEFYLLPIGSVTYKDTFFLGYDGLGAHLYQQGGWVFGPHLYYRAGRDADDNDKLRGLGDLDGSIEAGLHAFYDGPKIEAKFTLRFDISNNHEGYIFEGELSYKQEMKFSALDKPVMVKIGPSISLADKDYMRSYFGVNATQSARSGMAVYTPDGGHKDWGMNITALYPYDERWSIIGSAGVDFLGGDAADAPFVDDEVGYTLAIGSLYKF